MARVINSIAKRLANDPFKMANYFRKKGYDFGSDCEIYPGVGFGSEPYLIKLGDKVRVAAGVQFITHDGAMHVLRNNGLAPNADYFGKITIGNNVFIGTNSIILPGVTIGDNCIIGVGSVVTRDIASNSVAAGVPARFIKSVGEYFELKKDQIDYTKDLSSKAKRDYLLKKFNN